MSLKYLACAPLAHAHTPTIHPVKVSLPNILNTTLLITLDTLKYGHHRIFV